MQINDLRCQASSFRLIHFAFWHSIDILRGRAAMSANDAVDGSSTGT
jgi:hypothetical protein